MALNDVTLCTFRGYRGANPIIMTGQYRTTLSIGDKQMELVALGEVLEEVYFNLGSFPDATTFLQDTIYFYDIQLRDAIDPTVGYDHVFSSQYRGTLTGERLQTDACMLLLKKTTKIARYATGRNYFPFGTEDELFGGLWTQTLRDSVYDWKFNYTNFVTRLPNFSFKETVWSGTYQEYNDVENYSIIVEPRRQKRRRQF